jgi:hypothetical protein
MSRPSPTKVFSSNGSKSTIMGSLSKTPNPVPKDFTDALAAAHTAERKRHIPSTLLKRSASVEPPSKGKLRSGLASSTPVPFQLPPECLVPSIRPLVGVGTHTKTHAAKPF